MLILTTLKNLRESHHKLFGEYSTLINDIIVTTDIIITVPVNKLTAVLKLTVQIHYLTMHCICVLIRIDESKIA